MKQKKQVKKKKNKNESHHKEWHLPVPSPILSDPFAGTDPDADPKDLFWRKVFYDVYNNLKTIFHFGTITEISVNPRLTRSLARCLQAPEEPEGCFKIELSNQATALEDPKMLGDVIAHELIHTIPGCFNHSPNFKFMAEYARLKGYDVQTRFSYERYGLENPNAKKTEDYKYIVECQRCHQQIRRVRMSKLIEHPEQYRCTLCGGTFKRIV